MIVITSVVVAGMSVASGETFPALFADAQGKFLEQLMGDRIQLLTEQVQ